MSISNAVITDFYGVEKYDIIIYLTTLLKELGNKVLLIDRSENRALTDCISIPVEFDIKKNKVHYLGIDFTHEMPGENDLQTYTHILIDYGYQDMKKAEVEANNHIIVTDKQLHNLNRLKFKDKEKNSYLVFKDIGFNDKIEVLNSLFSEGLKVINSYFLQNDDLDRKLMYQLQYEKVIKGTSGQMKHLLQDILIKLFDIDKKQFKSVYKKLKKGRV